MFAPMAPERLYPSKILLAGEYTVLRGGSGFAIPWPRYAAKWEQIPDRGYPLAEDFIHYISQNAELASSLDLSALKIDAGKGWQVSTNIPFGYGLGSSGSFCAAIFDRFKIQEQLSVEHTHSLLKSLESYYHGNSSGLDPMVSYYARPVVIQNNVCRLTDPLSPELLCEKNVALIDSGAQRNTQELVRRFKEKCLETGFAQKIDELSLTNDRLFETLLQGRFESIKTHWREISILSRSLFQEMIPEKIRAFWDEGLTSESFYCKLCGAGGGGLFLVYYSDPAILLKRLQRHDLRLFDYL